MPFGKARREGVGRGRRGGTGWGRLLAVTGPSGAGKTTLLSAMAGILQPLSGAVTLGGEPLRGRDHAVARALALRGDVLLADEVTSELDAANRQVVLELLRAEADRGAAVVFATHDPEAAAACDAELHLLDERAPPDSDVRS
ncbi:ABC transporter ATP-binding protein [Solwaraspora sp. WMMB335]|uniref:ATP-binding cassette domain-containing protein n=1 Tax=Solwaraspora sp. WMMB335 TaxID=3404118 RepID=UPI003B95595D